MKKGFERNKLDLHSDTRPLYILYTAVILGIVAGCMLVTSLDANGRTQLTAFLTDYLFCASDQTTGVSYSGLVFQWTQRIVLAFLIECSVFRMIGLPVFLFLQGLILSFAVSCFIMVFAFPGLVTAFVLFALPALFFFFGLFCMHRPLSGIASGRECHRERTFLITGIYLFTLTAITLSECFIIMKLLPVAAKFAVSSHIM